MSESFEDAAHVVPGGVAEQLEELGLETVLEWPDNLAHGPVSEDPKDHHEKRLDYWRDRYGRALGGEADETVEEAIGELEAGYMSTEQIGSVAAHHADERPVILWSAPTIQDRLFLWACFDAVRSADVALGRVGTAEPQIPDPTTEDRYLPLRELEVAELAEGLETILFPEDVYQKAGAQLWQTFASGSPREFAISIPHTEKFFPNIEHVGECYGSMFPRLDGEGAETLRLSDYDTALFDHLATDAWRGPMEVLGHEMIGKFGFVDDVVQVARLVDWADINGPNYVEMRAGDSEGPFGGREFRLTERGEALAEEGFVEEDEAPVLEFGDARIYAGPTPWAKVVEGEHWWFERHD